MQEMAVCIFAYCRPVKLKQLFYTIDSSNNNDGVAYRIFIDGPKGTDQIGDVSSCLELAQSFALGKNARIFSSSQNKGLANSIIGGVSETLREYENVIVLEDDLVLHEDFFNYMRLTIPLMNQLENVLNVSAYQYPKASISYQLNDGSRLLLLRRPHTWGWAINRKNWNRLDWSHNNISQWLKDESYCINLARMGPDLKAMLNAQLDGKLDSWGVRMAANQCKQDMFTIYPEHSFVQNDGFGVGATHTALDNPTSYNENFSCEIDEIKPNHLRNFYPENQAIFNRFFGDPQSVSSQQRLLRRVLDSPFLQRLRGR